MAQVKIKDSWHAERETVYVGENSYDIGRGSDAWISVPDRVADQLDNKIFEIINGKKPVNKPIKEKPIVQEEEIETIEEIVEEVQVKKVEPSILKRIKEVAEDLMDDGKLNHSNNPNKKSPGRKKRR